MGNPNDVDVSFYWSGLAGSVSLYRPGWKPGTTEADGSEREFFPAEKEADGEDKPVAMAMTVTSDPDAWEDGIRLQLDNHRLQFTDDDHVLWLDVGIYLSWDQVKKLRDGLSLMLNFRPPD